MPSRMLLVIALLLMVALPATAQKKDKKTAMPSQEEMMKRWKEAATPGEAHKVLDNFVGSWETESSVWMDGPGKPPSVTEGMAEVKWVLDGRFVQQEMTGEMMGAPMNGVGFYGYDNFKKKYTSFWIDNTGTAMFTSEGTIDKDGKVLTCDGKTDDPATGQKDKKVRYVEIIIDHDKHIFSILDLSIAGADKKVVEIVYTRKK